MVTMMFGGLGVFSGLVFGFPKPSNWNKGRLSALMELPTIFIFTHDAMGDGEDGPTHQPVEHLASLRAIPGLVTMRPGDANEGRPVAPDGISLLNRAPRFDAA